MPLGYCSKCKIMVEIDGGEEFTSKGKTKRPGIRGSCPTCGSTVIHWIKSHADVDLSQGSAPEEIPSGDKDGGPSLPASGVPEEPAPEEPVEPPPIPTPPPTAPPPAPAESKEETEEEEEEEEEGFDWKGIIPIIVVIGGLLVLVVGLWLMFIRSEKKKEEKAKQERTRTQQDQGPASMGDVLPEV